MTPAASSVFAVELLGELIRRGVTDAVVCPGSRSQALALAAAAAERVGALRLHVRIDERSAAFFALGIARETGVPAPVIVTSGTAVANLGPAVLEAHEGRVPLLLLTADRPEELRGIRSNQTTRQAGLFRDVARLSLDVPASDDRDPGGLADSVLAAALGAAGGLPAGPVHLNLAFREPLSGTQGFDEMIADGFRAAAEESRDREASGPVPGSQDRTSAHVLANDAATVVIAGADAGPAASEFAAAAGLPLLAEAVSGARREGAVPNYAALLDDPELGGRIRRAIVFGHPTLTRQVPALLMRDDVETIVVDRHEGADHYDPSRRARVVAEVSLAEDYIADRDWLEAWREAAAPLGSTEGDGQITREDLSLAVWAATGPGDRLVLAASRLVRALDAVAPPRAARVHANRGLGGIDGTVATALGVAAAQQRESTAFAVRPETHTASASGAVTRVLIGDLALLHDAGSLHLTAGEPRPRIQLVVGNDGGGSIFDRLEVADTADPDAYDRVMYTPQRVDIRALAAAYGWEYALAETRTGLEALLADPAHLAAPTLIEVPLAR